MRGAVVVDVGAKELPAARAALARAVASGALGPGYAVKRDGDGLTFDARAARGDGPDRGRLELTADGRMTFDVSLAGAERQRFAEAIVIATFLSVAAVFGWSFMFYTSLPTGGVVGLVYAIARVAGDRARVRRHLRALAASLPVLVDARGE